MHIPWHLQSVVIGVNEQWGLFAVTKPVDVLSHPNREKTVAISALVQMPYDFKEECYILESGYQLYLLNRLDSPTSGIILLSTNAQTAKKVRTLFAERKIFKEYTALVKGSIAGKCFWKDYLKTSKTPQSQLRSRVSDTGGLTAITEVVFKKAHNIGGITVSQIALHPNTGRTHQLRIQCASHGHPILGDRTYGDFSLNRKLKLKRLYLHAAKIVFNLENEPIEFVCPADFF